MIYELWDVESGNIVQAYEREDDALALVRLALETHGPTYVEELALLRDDGHGNVITLAVGTALAERARAAVPVA